MDMIRKGYTTKMRLWADRDELVEVRWFECPPGARQLPGYHGTCSALWDVDVRQARLEDDYTGIGEQWPQRIKASSLANPQDYTGRNLCGSIEASLRGGIHGVDPEHITGPGGRPACCASPAVLPTGGLALAGTGFPRGTAMMASGGLAFAGHGYTEGGLAVGGGGFVRGGLAVGGSGYVEGGLALGGAATISGMSPSGVATACCPSDLIPMDLVIRFKDHATGTPLAGHIDLTATIGSTWAGSGPIDTPTWTGHTWTVEFSCLLGFWLCRVDFGDGLGFGAYRAAGTFNCSTAHFVVNTMPSPPYTGEAIDPVIDPT